MYSAISNAQMVISGIVIDKDNEPVSNASVYITGDKSIISTGKNGEFQINTDIKKGYLNIRHISFEPKSLYFDKSIDFGKIKLRIIDNSLNKIIITGITDYALNRKTPVSSSVILSKNIIHAIKNKSIPEILNFTPSVYATKSGGGFGDAKISIRGFDQQHVAILLNGIPLNDMENSGMYWSNILGIENNLSAIQVQRGLGFSKLAISSIGGTINLITNPSSKKKGAKIEFGIANNNGKNLQLSYSSGLLANGLSFSANVGRQNGATQIKGTSYLAYNYFFDLAWKNKSHSVQLLILGSPQVHGQRAYSYFNMATIEQYLKYGSDYNYNFGYLENKGYNWYSNYYHKPISSLSWDWNINKSTNISTNIYTSLGRGGGTSDLGRLPGNKFASSYIFRDDKGLVRFDDIVKYNSGSEVVFSDGKSYKRESNQDGLYINSFKNAGLTRRAFTNSHTWFGTIIDINRKFGKYIKTNLGTDIRTSRGTNYVRLNNLLGADAYLDFFDKNNPNNIVDKTYDVNINSVLNVFHDTDKDKKIFFHESGLVKWAGLFSGIEYSKDKIFAFLQFSLSKQSFKRIDYFNYLKDDSKKESNWIDILGGNIKSGINFNINSNNSIYTNIGYYSKQPGFNVVFLNHDNTVNDNYKNEKITGIELGYSFKNSKLRIKANLYQTEWKNRFIQIDFENENTRGKAKILNLGEIHRGFEFESTYKFDTKLELQGMFSIGDWYYSNNVRAKAYDKSLKYIGEVNLKLKRLPIPNTSQLNAGLAVKYELLHNLKLNINQYFSSKLYGNIAAEDNWKGYNTPLRLPDYTLTGLEVLYKLTIGNASVNSIDFGLKIDNLFDTKYIAESATNYEKAKDDKENWKGINKKNKVFFGFGRTFSLTGSISF